MYSNIEGRTRDLSATENLHDTSGSLRVGILMTISSKGWEFS